MIGFSHLRTNLRKHRHSRFVRWIPFFSRTGGEIYRAIKTTGIVPEIIITNKKDFTNVHEGLMNEYSHLFRVLPNAPSSGHYITLLRPYNQYETLITLNGYLRIIPEYVCQQYNMYNLHPGLITEYPLLKGKDPQVRAFEAGHKTAGCVIHRVAPGVDEGEVLADMSVVIADLSLDEVYSKLADVADKLWAKFLQEAFNASWDIGSTVNR